jgi:Bax protein
MPAAPLAPATGSASEQQRSENATTASAVAVANNVVEPPEYDLEVVAAGAAVPRIFGGSPENSEAAGHKTRGEENWRTILPLVLFVNEDILADRKKLWKIRHNLNLGERLLPEQRIWLELASERYAAPGGDLDELARRMDVVLAAVRRMQSGAQVAARGAKSAVAERRQVLGETPHHLDSPFDAVRAYVRAVNTASAYDGFRKERERIRCGRAPRRPASGSLPPEASAEQSAQRGGIERDDHRPPPDAL